MFYLYQIAAGLFILFLCVYPVWRPSPKIATAIRAQAKWIGKITCGVSQRDRPYLSAQPFEVSLYEGLVILSLSKELDSAPHYVLITPHEWNNSRLKSPLRFATLFLVRDVGFHSFTRRMVLMGKDFCYKDALSYWFHAQSTRIEILEGDSNVLQLFEELWSDFIGNELQKYRTFGLEVTDM